MSIAVARDLSRALSVSSPVPSPVVSPVASPVASPVVSPSHPQALAPEHSSYDELYLENVKRRRLDPLAELLSIGDITTNWGQDAISGVANKRRPETKQQRRMRHLEACERHYAEEATEAKKWWSTELQRQRKKKGLPALQDDWYQVLRAAWWVYDHPDATVGDDPHYWFPLWFMKMHREVSIKSAKQKKIFIEEHCGPLLCAHVSNYSPPIDEKYSPLSPSFSPTSPTYSPKSPSYQSPTNPSSGAIGADNNPPPPNVPIIDLSGPDGNCFSLMSHVERFGSSVGLDDVVIESIVKDMQSSDYKHVLDVFHRYFPTRRSD